MAHSFGFGAAALTAAVVFASPAAAAAQAAAPAAASAVLTPSSGAGPAAEAGAASQVGLAHPVNQAAQAGDPYEGLNRAIFRFNHGLDRAVIRPLAVGYHRIVPRPLRLALHNVVANLGEPAVAINDLLQGHGVKAARTVTRFAANSTIGVAGIFDVASRASLPHHNNDFGVTLAKYGARPGPYLVLPLMGPSTVRDAAGRLVDFALNPLNYAGYPGAADVGAGAAVEGGLDARAAVDDDLKTVYASATDPYAYLRSLYLQNRQSEVTGGRVDVEQLPAFDDQTASAPAAPPPSAAPQAAQSATPPLLDAALRLGDAGEPAAGQADGSTAGALESPTAALAGRPPPKADASTTAASAVPPGSDAQAPIR
jgi:phospholipid-binding lipoprotein MlaA